MTDINMSPTPIITFDAKTTTKFDAWEQVKKLSSFLGFSPHVWRKDHNETSWRWYIADVESIRAQEVSIGKRVALEQKNWKEIPWNLVNPGQTIWLAGTQDGMFRAYGPHIVDDPEKRTLISGTPEMEGKTFTHMMENLLILAWGTDTRGW